MTEETGKGRKKRSTAQAPGSRDGGRDRRKDIAEAALRVFAREGFERATIKKIAAEANIKSAALIYWYFDNKAELLEAALMAGLGEWTASAPLDPDMDPQTVLEMVARGFMQALLDDRVGQVLLVGLSQLLQRPEILDRFAREGPLRTIGGLEGYLQSQVERGRLRPHDSSTVARWFFFGLLGYALHHELAESLRHALPPPDQYVSTILDVLQWGLEPEEAGHARPGTGGSKGGGHA